MSALCQKRTLAARWFCKLDLEDEIPHHPTLSANRPVDRLARELELFCDDCRPHAFIG
jgi:hypothetical protein